MPKLLMFVPCERVIIGQGDNSVSLIILIQTLQLRLFGTPKEISENEGVAASFSIFTQWHKVPSDEGKTFEQRYTLGKSGEASTHKFEAMMEFIMPQQFHRLVSTVEAIPLLAPGQYELCLWLREKGQSEWPVAPLAQYPIEITHAENVAVQANK